MTYLVSHRSRDDEEDQKEKKSKAEDKKVRKLLASAPHLNRASIMRADEKTPTQLREL